MIISVCVITYNSSNTVIETLESIKSQNYKDIELIISDDCSTDDTVSKCNEWLLVNSNNFVHSRIVTSQINTGIPGNLNRAISSSSGEWIRSIAGDDVMLPNDISFYIKQIASYPDNLIFLSKVQAFHNSTNGQKILSPVIDNDKIIDDFNLLPAKEQCKYILDYGGDFLSAPTLFVKSTILRQYPYDERYKYMEDYPQWTRLTNEGFQIRVFKERNVLYRKSDSVSRKNNAYYSQRNIETKRLFFWNQKIHLLRKYNCKTGYNDDRKLFLTLDLIEAYTKNRRTFFNSIKVFVIRLIVQRVHYRL